MKQLYRACFQTGTKMPTEIKDIGKSIRDWAKKRCGTDILEFNEECNQRIKNPSTGDIVDIKAAFMDRNGKPCFAFEIVHPDSKYKERVWRSTFAFSRSDDNLIDSEITVSTQWNGEPFKENVVRRTRPTIVPYLIENFGASYGMDLFDKPLKLTIDDVPRFAQDLTGTYRKLPIILISPLNSTDKPILEDWQIETMARHLAGIAHIFVSETRFPTLKLKTYIGATMCCYNGAVRLYWPRSESETSADMFNPYWLPKASPTSHMFFNEILMQKISSFVAGIKFPVKYSDLVERMASIKAERTMTSPETQKILGENKDLREIFELASAENKDLRKTVTDQEERISELEMKYLEAQGTIERLQYTIDEISSIRGRASKEEQKISFKSVAEAVEMIKRKYPENTIVITPMAMKGAKESIYSEPENVYDALEWLATIYLTEGKRNVPALKASCMQRCRMTYEPGQGHSMNVHYEDYHVVFEGKEYTLREHLAKGNSRNSRHTIRIGFAYDKESRRVIVGYISQHQETAAT